MSHLLDGGRVHFIGIGGAGMSAIAKVLMERGVPVSGSDLKRSRSTAGLEAIGADVTIGHEAGSVEGASVVVASAAVPASNVELKRAHELGTEVMSRGEALAAVLSSTRPIVVAGTHGKTTTTSMIVSILRATGADPTYLVGGGLNDAGTNARAGLGELSVAESDESDGSFLLLEPHIAVITNIEEDHLDHWGSLEAIRAAFEGFLERVDPSGAVILPAADRPLVALASTRGSKVVTFGDGGQVHARSIAPHHSGMQFQVDAHDEIADVELRVPGEHNVANALAAIAASLEAGVSLKDAAAALKSYRGVERRFQVRGEVGGITVIDDYAHHPTEIKATLAAARPGPWRRVVAVFQPHRYSRTASLGTRFGSAFSEADRVVVTDIYGAGEEPVPGVTGRIVSDAVAESLPGRGVAYLPHRNELLAYLGATLRSGDAVLTLGAGDITSVGDELLALLESRDGSR